ncbi:YecA protein [Pseudomonas serboccidentalis]
MQAVAGQICRAAGLSAQEGLEFPHCLFPQGSPVMSFAEQLTRLQVFLDADELHEEALDYVAAHGYLTALSICSDIVPDREWIDALFAEEPHYSSDAQRAEIEATLIGLKAHIARQLASDEEFELPCDLDLGDEPDDSELRGWCIGFMEGVFLREAAWFETAEEEVSEMLLPIMVGSGLFDEQPEFEDIAKDANLMDDMIVQIPEALTALYLLCQAPDEKPAILKPRHH